ncbi:response regulator [Nannocystis pusilla]|jgi:DNA-binding NarL/FixJ family response regulator|uniref:Response regulator transcription factor n=1 Tax=Nannocystis pusilla TaxID=889268 RepID=A0ABS7TK93_9BACT|nr:response regulator transcription factor [Nannocystis pusilla]MBZ5708629.1 response regulator transcription factor [Nannocystis pusilla]
MRPSVMLVDDHTLVLEALAALLRPEFGVLGLFTDAAAALAAALRLHPDLLLLEVELPGRQGVDLVRQLRRSNSAVRCVFVTQRADPVRARECLAAGAWGYVLKDASPAELIAGLRTVAAGGVHVSPQIEALLARREASAPGRRHSLDLTERQQEVLARVAAGMAGKEIATDLGIALKTVEFHKCRISRQLGLNSTAAMTRYAIERGLVHERKRD